MQTMMQILDCFKLYILFITCDGFGAELYRKLIFGDAMQRSLLAFRVSLAFEGGEKTDDSLRAI
jgi:hypothetical protein